jgi:2-phospho-L-lactate guanylyltransferase
LLAIIPFNSPASAMRRLDPLLEPEERARLVRLMLADVVEACAAATAVQGVLVVTPDPDIAPGGTEVLRDGGDGHAAAIAAALAGCDGEGALVVMADCPLVRPDVLDLLCDTAQPVALCPAQDGGTNALALRPADVLEPAFGVPDGARVTVLRARSLGVEASVIEDELVALDIDRPEDVRRLLALGAETQSGRFLDQTLGISAHLRVSGR